MILAPAIRDSERPLTPFDVPIHIAGERLVVALAELASVNRDGLGKSIATLREHEDAFRRAIDRLFTGF